MAKFLLAAGEEYGWKPFVKKKIHASFGWQLERHGFGSGDDCVLFPLFNRSNKVSLFLLLLVLFIC